MGRDVEHDKWQSRYLTLLEDLKAAGDWSDEEQAVFDKFMELWF